MREILFRGQTRRKGEKVRMGDGKPIDSNWVYGGIFPQNKDGDFSIIYQYEPIEKRVVYADTVGQYTGKPDKNDEKIFEHDIVSIFGEDGFFEVMWDNDTARFIMTGYSVTVDFDNYDSKDIEVIGNIFDNPDLLTTSSTDSD